jgi:hypothetical protein
VNDSDSDNWVDNSDSDYNSGSYEDDEDDSSADPEDLDDSSDSNWGNPDAGAAAAASAVHAGAAAAVGAGAAGVASAVDAGAAAAVDAGAAGVASAATAVVPGSPDGHMCRCGSLTHQTVAHHLCPINNSNDVLEMFAGDEYKRLLRYVPRKYLYRYYDYEDGTRRRCYGSVTEVTENCLLRVTYTDGGTDDVTEEELLKIIAVMKKDRARKRKRSGSTTIPRRKLFHARL